jgi:type III secretion protein J
LGETYKQASLVPTATEERARFVDALTGELERTLEVVEGVVRARVHLVLPELDPMSLDPKPRVPAQAAILIKSRAGQPPPISEADIQKLVAGSVPSLLPEKVAVVVIPAPEVPAVGSGLVALGPLRLSAGSRAIVLAGFGAVALILAALAALLIVMARRLANAQARKADELA